MSSERFESLEDDLISLTKTLTNKIHNHLPKVSGQAKINLGRDIQRELDDAQQMLEDLEMEARVAPYSYRMQMNNRLKGYRQEISVLKKKSTQLESASSSTKRNQLLGNPNEYGSSTSTMAAGNRGRLLQMNETIERTTETVNRTHQIAAETDQVGIAVVDELGAQRESLIRTKERLVDTDDNLTRSRKILRSMYRRVMTNKLILIVIIILEIAILCGVVYYKFFRK